MNFIDHVFFNVELNSQLLAISFCTMIAFLGLWIIVRARWASAVALVSLQFCLLAAVGLAGHAVETGAFERLWVEVESLPADPHAFESCSSSALLLMISTLTLLQVLKNRR